MGLSQGLATGRTEYMLDLRSYLFNSFKEIILCGRCILFTYLYEIFVDPFTFLHDIIVV